MKLQTTKIAVNLKITEEQNCNIWTNVVYLQTNVQTMEAEVFKNNEFAEVNKAIRTYVDGMDTSKRFKIKSDDLTYTNFFQNKMLIIHSIRQGFPYNLFSLIKEVTPFTESDWAEYLNLSIKTLHRYKKEAAFHFKPSHRKNYRTRRGN